MIRIPVHVLPNAEKSHFEAIRSYVKRKDRQYQQALFADVTAAMPFPLPFEDAENADDWGWLEQFILMDLATMKNMVQNAARLQFDQFQIMYARYFSNGYTKYLDADTCYNAYAFIRNLGIKICPYCDEEYLDILLPLGRPAARTMDIDHFFPEGRYPALAMCFYNLVPCGKVCNDLKLSQPLFKNPYEADIENCAWLYPDIPIGANMESVSAEQCTIHFHPRGGMEQNIDVLRLEDRYEHHRDEAHRLLTIRQQYNEEKLCELVRLGAFSSLEEAYRLFNIPQGIGQQPLGKLARDLMGWR